MPNALDAVTAATGAEATAADLADLAVVQLEPFKRCLREFLALRMRVLRAGPTQNAALQKEHGRRRKVSDKI